ncbi:hypothetical protein, partial [Streptomyces bacillaris]|uniref:hypothetical protein n=1 Tax=Streptomyces bacillaris TaxID=68179 RepID=UPI00345F1ACC
MLLPSASIVAAWWTPPPGGGVAPGGPGGAGGHARHALLQERLAVHPLGDALAVQVRRDAAQV